MAHDRYDPELYRLGRVPDPRQLSRLFSFPQTVPMILPLPKSGGVAVVLVGYSPRYSVIPAAHFDHDGVRRELPKAGLVKSSREDLPFALEIQSDRPLRTKRDPIELGEHWAQEYLDKPTP